MKTFLECLDEAAAITEAHHISAFIKLNLDKIHLIMLQAAADIYASQSNSHKHGVMQTLPFSFVEWYSGMQKEKIESAYKRWMKEGNVAVADGAAGKTVSECNHIWFVTKTMDNGSGLSRNYKCSKCGKTKYD